jgi:hypothetical protein
MGVGAYCLICDKSFGWRCKESPDGVCHYKNEVDDKQLLLINGKTVDAPADYAEHYYESCIYCGQPEERK